MDYVPIVCHEALAAFVKSGLPQVQQFAANASCTFLIRLRYASITFSGWGVAIRPGVPESEVVLRGCPGHICPDQLPRYGPYARQALLPHQEVADAYRGAGRRPYHRRIPPPHRELKQTMLSHKHYP